MPIRHSSDNISFYGIDLAVAASSNSSLITVLGLVTGIFKTAPEETIRISYAVVTVSWHVPTARSARSPSTASSDSMSSSGSSFTSSSLGRPPTYGRTYVSPVDSTWTPTSGISTISAPTTEGSGIGTSVLDLGPPGFQATMCDHPDI